MGHSYAGKLNEYGKNVIDNALSDAKTKGINVPKEALLWIFTYKSVNSKLDFL